ncbi:MAG: hypothetical protein CMK71_02470 [Pseudomonadaceae bacterium]|nr:hypothetical protein [Pseudomonadaceae bacterium]
MTTKLGLTDLVNGQANYLNANQTFALLNQLVQGAVVDKDLAAPPGSPADESLYIVAASATGAWSGKSGFLAFWLNSVGSWTFVTPREGMWFHVNDEDAFYKYTGSAWEVFSGGGGGGMTNPMTTPADIIVGGASGVPSRLAKGAAFQVLRVNAGGTALEYADPAGGSSSVAIEDNGTPVASATTLNFVGATIADVGGGQVDVTISGGGGGLINLTEAKSTDSPNNIVSVVSLTNSASEANSDLSVIPKGSGALIAAVPDGLASGGNKRGAYAVDLQLKRSSASNVANGYASTIGGGDDNTASATRSTVSGGFSNVASGGTSAVLGGQYCTSSGVSSIAGGGACTASGQGAVAMGTSCQAGASGSISLGISSIASGEAAVCIGRGGQANSSYSTVLGRSGSARYVVNSFIFSSYIFGAQYSSQAGKYVIGAATSSATPTKLASDQSSPSATNQVTLPNNAAYAFSGKVVVREGSTGDCAAWSISGLLRRGSSAATTAIVGTPTKTLLGADAGASSWDIALSADTTNGALALTVTGEASHSLRWVADIETAEVMG